MSVVMFVFPMCQWSAGRWTAGKGIVYMIINTIGHHCNHYLTPTQYDCKMGSILGRVLSYLDIEGRFCSDDLCFLDL